MIDLLFEEVFLVFWHLFWELQAKADCTYQVHRAAKSTSNSFVTARYNSVLSCKARQNMLQSKPQDKCRHMRSSLPDLCS